MTDIKLPNKKNTRFKSKHKFLVYFSIMNIIVTFQINFTKITSFSKNISELR